MYFKDRLDYVSFLLDVASCRVVRVELIPPDRAAIFRRSFDNLTKHIYCFYGEEGWIYKGMEVVEA